MSILYWEIGRKINEEISYYNRSDTYGREIVATLWRQLTDEYGAAVAEKNLRRMIQFAKVFPKRNEVVTLSRELSWSHIKILIPIDNKVKRTFYIEMCKLEKWSVRTFQSRINSMLYERTAISKKPEETIQNELEQLHQEQKVTPDLVF